MVHTARDQKKLLNRVRRIRGQLDAIERSLAAEAACEEVLQQLTSCRGALNGLLAEVLEDHIRTHLVPADTSTPHDSDVCEQLIDVVHSYFK